ncbi:trehalose-phosphatase-domain-containing protein [Dunaliella salina]|uniref:Trehalose-phosphatase-domain-containing protein n=1 Tax=Dunaliella salina TaxID=3046 RepID=A0ABQ7G9F7_DUNSA|nr:trehalose-phosphatase-domain-containing protein [Dunaliella salina]|eukprot:KAF5831234.1 trehalose-phosphatase-domain-containing protein [Dunaliella salina]
MRTQAKAQSTCERKCEKTSNSRVFFLDYDGTLTAGQHTSITLAPLEEVLQVLRALTAEPRNKVVLFSGRPKAELQEWFASVPNLALVAENGCYLRLGEGQTWNTLTPGLQGADQAWVSLVVAADFGWKKMALPILQQYQESTDGSSIEAKESALVWYYKEADPDFGSWQLYGYPALADRRSGLTSSGRLPPAGGLSRLQSMESGESGPAGQQQGAPITAGSAALASTSQGGQQGGAAERRGSLGNGPDFVLCIGDDRSDEDMFTSIETMRASPHMMTSEVYACTVGQKPSRAPFYLNDPGEVLHLLARLVGMNLQNLPSYS